MGAAKLGIGAAAFPFVYGMLQSKVLLRMSSAQFAQNTPGEYAARAVSGVVLGALTSRLLKQTRVGDGMMAAAVGSVFKDLLAGWMNPAAATAQKAVTAAEQTTGEPQVSATNPLGSGLAGLGLGLAGANASSLGSANNDNQALLFGVGTPDLSGAEMFSGATVAIEDTTNALSGATIAIEQPSNFAASLS
jgi:hypothetical protein